MASPASKCVNPGGPIIRKGGGKRKKVVIKRRRCMRPQGG